MSSPRGKRRVLDSTPSVRPPKRSRKNDISKSIPDLDADHPQPVTDTSDSLQILRASWRLLNFFEFCRIYRSLFALPRFSLDDLEKDLLSSDADDTNSSPPERPKIVAEVIIRLLSNLKVKGFSSITSDNWQAVLKRLSSVYYNPLLFPDDSFFESLPLASRIHLLHFISELVLENNLEKVANIDLEPDQQRVFPIGEDSNGRTYWLFGDNRLYIERPAKKVSTPNEYSFALIASTLESWETCLDPLNRSRSKIDKQLLEILKPVAEASRAKLAAKEREAARQAYLESLPKKRSERILAKQAQEEEKARLDQLMKEQAIADAVRKAEGNRLKEEERRRKLEEEAEEDRRRNAEQKAFQIEQARLQAEERKRIKNLMEVSEKALLADLNEILQNRNLPSEPMKSPQPIYSMAKLLIQGKDMPKLVRFSKDLAAHNSISLTGRPGRLAIPTLAEFWLGSEENGKEMNSVLKLWCRDLLDNLIAMEDAGPFVEPVDTVALDIPHYLTVITTPMDFGTIRQKSVCSMYADFREFWEDIRLVLNNCIKFNGVKSPYSTLARKIEDVIVDMVTSCGFVVEEEDFVPEGFKVPEKEPTPTPSPSPLASSEPPEGTPRTLRPRRAAVARKSFKEESDEDDDSIGLQNKMKRIPIRKAAEPAGPYGAVRLQERHLLPKKGAELPRIQTDFQDHSGRIYQPLALQPQQQQHSAAMGADQSASNPSSSHPNHHPHLHHVHYAAHPLASPASNHSTSLPVYHTWHPSTPVHGNPTRTQYLNNRISTLDNHQHQHQHQHPHLQQRQYIQPRIAPAPSPIHGSVVSPFALPSPSIARGVSWPIAPPPPRYVTHPHEFFHRFPPPPTATTTTTLTPTRGQYVESCGEVLRKDGCMRENGESRGM